MLKSFKIADQLIEEWKEIKRKEYSEAENILKKIEEI
jgi:hypothetical protein